MCRGWGILANFRILCIPQYTIVKTAMFLLNTVNTELITEKKRGISDYELMSSIHGIQGIPNIFVLVITWYPQYTTKSKQAPKMLKCPVLQHPR